MRRKRWPIRAWYSVIRSWMRQPPWVIGSDCGTVSDGVRVPVHSDYGAGARFLPVAADGFPRLAELSFTSARGPGLFGNKDQLLDEWRRKLAVVAAQSPDE